MPALKDPPTAMGRLFEPPLERSLDHLLREMDDALNHGQPVACLVCGAVTAGGDLSTPAECKSCGSILE
jgi:hypothetical protein